MAAPLYRVRIRSFNNTTSYGKGEVIAEFQNAKNIGWSHYVNDVPEMFFTLNQDDPKIALLRDVIQGECHVEVLRGSTLVWSGWPLETSETEEDVVIYAYGYAAGLFWLHTDWDQSWTDAQIDAIVNDVMDRAIGAEPDVLTDSLLKFVTFGTVEAPVTTSGGATPIVLPEYKTYLKRILLVLRELTALAQSDTTNRAWWEITPDGVFNYWKNRGSDLTSIRWEYPAQIRGFARVRLPAHRRNVIHAVGSSPRDVVLRTTQENATDRANQGRREEAIFLSWVRGQGALERIAKLRLRRARRTESHLRVRLHRNSVVPFPAGDFNLMDTVPVKIDHGLTSIDTNLLVVGQEVIVEDGEELVMPILQDKPI